MHWAIPRSRPQRWCVRVGTWWRITCRYRWRHKNGNFRKFKIADGRHFETSCMPISQQWIIRFRSNLVRRCRFPSWRWWFYKKIDILQIQDGGRTPYWTSYFVCISATYWPITATFGSEMKNHIFLNCHFGHVTYICVRFFISGPNFTSIGQCVAEIQPKYHFQYGVRLPSWICRLSIFWQISIFGMKIRIFVLNLIEIGQFTAEIWR